MTQRAGLYVRVSTDQQTEKFSLPAQRKALTEHCQREGWAFTVYEDAGISGETIEARPAFKRLLNDAKDRKFDIVLAVEMERFSRSTDLFDWLTIRQTFRKAGIRFGTPAQLFDPDDVEDRFLSLLFGGLASREKEKFMARSRRGKVEASQQGKWVAGGRAPFGYCVDGSQLLRKDSEAKVVERIFDLARAGHTVSEIARILNSQRVPTMNASRGSFQVGTEWVPGPISAMLRNPVYRGEAAWGRRSRSQQAIPIKGPGHRRGKRLGGHPEGPEGPRTPHREARRARLSAVWPYLLRGVQRSASW